jgi:hypothetical protein
MKKEFVPWSWLFRWLVSQVVSQSVSQSVILTGYRPQSKGYRAAAMLKFSKKETKTKNKANKSCTFLKSF